MLLCTRVYGYICLQGFYDGTSNICLGGSGLGMGVDHPPCKFISSVVEIWLHFVVTFYYDIMIIIFLNGLHYY